MRYIVEVSDLELLPVTEEEGNEIDFELGVGWVANLTNLVTQVAEIPKYHSLLMCEGVEGKLPMVTSHSALSHTAERKLVN